jgi:formate-dependent nitrite reductase membrane component NrfD
VILTAFSALIGLHLLASFFSDNPPRAFAVAGIVLAIATGTYTALLFAQAKARDLWQSPLLPPQHLVQCILAGAATLLLAAAIVDSSFVLLFARITAAAALVHLLLIAAEIMTPHTTAHARLAVHEMVRGRYRVAFAAGVILQFAGLLAVPFGVAAAPFVLAGLLAHERAHVGAGQAVPLA